jgi:hypothetical protein
MDDIILSHQQINGKPRTINKIDDAKSYESDIQNFLENLKDNEGVLKEILDSFPQQAHDRMEKLSFALSSKIFNEIALAAHKITALFSTVPIHAAAPALAVFGHCTGDDVIDADNLSVPGGRGRIHAAGSLQILLLYHALEMFALEHVEFAHF